MQYPKHYYCQIKFSRYCPSVAIFLSEHKSEPYFASMINVATEYNCRIIRVWSIAGHGKSEADHIGGLGRLQSEGPLEKASH